LVNILLQILAFRSGNKHTPLLEQMSVLVQPVSRHHSGPTHHKMLPPPLVEAFLTI